MEIVYWVGLAITTAALWVRLGVRWSQLSYDDRGDGAVVIPAILAAFCYPWVWPASGPFYIGMGVKWILKWIDEKK